MKLSLLLLLAGCAMLLLLVCLDHTFRISFLSFILLPALFTLGIVPYMRVKLALKKDGIYQESRLFRSRSLLAPWRQVQRIDKKRLRFHSSLQKVTIYLSGDRKLQFIMPHAEEFFKELQFRVL